MPTIVGMIDAVPPMHLVVATGPLLETRPYEQGVGETFLWRLGDFEWTLLELKVRRDDGAVVGVTLPAFRGRVLERTPVNTAMSSVVGVPAVDTSCISVKSSMLDEHRELSMYLDSDTMHLVLEEDFAEAVSMGVDRFRFFVAGARLAALTFGPLTPEEHTAIVRILESTGLTIPGR